MKKTMLSLLLILALSLISAMAVADVPQLLNYQGYLTDDSGQPVANDVYSITFSIYGGGYPSALWTEVMDIEVNNGLFNVVLGNETPLPSSTFESSEIYLGIKVGSDPEIAPRTRITSAPYAMMAKTLDASTGSEIDGNVNITGNFEVTGDVVIGEAGAKGIMQVYYPVTAAVSVISPELSYDFPKSRVYSIHPAQFHPWTNDPSSSGTYWIGGSPTGAFYVSGLGNFIAGINLPDGADLSSITAYFHSMAGATININMYATEMATGTNLPMASFQSENVFGYTSVSYYDISNDVIDNVNHAYSITASSSNWNVDLRLLGLRIYYSVEEPD